MANIALVDDHALLRNGLASLVKSLGHSVLLEATNGKDFIAKLNASLLPDLVLMDINMPEMDGYETALWLKQHHPGVVVMALSMYDTEAAIIRMMKCGAKGYILKDSEPSELQDALDSLFTKGYYYSDLVNVRMIDVITNLDNNSNDIKSLVQITDKETEFLKLICTELTYKEIAEKMQLSPRTIDNYRDNLFEKLNVKTRIGLAMYAVRNGVVQF
jgi:two-component system, NarL family, invasion response regulator UvrY